MFCTGCGAKLADGAASCPNCGLVFEKAVAVPSSDSQQGIPGYFRLRPERTASISLILGILALLFSIVTGIPAIILGHISLDEIKKSSGRLTGREAAIAGLVLGYLSVVMVPFLLMIAIPSLQRSKAVANQTEAATTVRTLIVAQSTYSTNYPTAGYAPDLVTLGRGASTCTGEGTQKNACLIDDELGCSKGTSGQWCTRDQYRYSIVGIKKNETTENYIITATPVDTTAGGTSYCAASDGIVRYLPRSLLSGPVTTVAECNAWPAL